MGLRNMSDAPDPLAVMEQALWSALDGNVNWGQKTGCIDIVFDFEKITPAVLDYLAEASTITTVEQLDALPPMSVVLSSDNAWTRRARSWYCPRGSAAGNGPQLPALLLYHPAARHR
jgi:hypothetical protein